MIPVWHKQIPDGTYLRIAFWVVFSLLFAFLHTHARAKGNAKGKMKVLIAGCSGYLGVELCCKFRTLGWQVFGIDPNTFPATGQLAVRGGSKEGFELGEYALMRGGKLLGKFAVLLRLHGNDVS